MSFQLAQCFAVLGLLIGAWSGTAVAQIDAPPTIVSEGTAEIGATPGSAWFELRKTESGANVSANTERLLTFEQKLRQSLDDLDLEAFALEFSGVRVAQAGGREVSMSARLGFSFARTAGNSQRALHLASLSDRIRNLSISLGCEVEGPDFEVDDRQVVEQEAIARATENALYRADAIASLMKAKIYSVQQVRVLNVAWSGNEASVPTREADTLQTWCRARVEVVYIFEVR